MLEKIQAKTLIFQSRLTPSVKDIIVKENISVKELFNRNQDRTKRNLMPTNNSPLRTVPYDQQPYFRKCVLVVNRLSRNTHNICNYCNSFVMC